MKFRLQTLFTGLIMVWTVRTKPTNPPETNKPDPTSRTSDPATDSPSTTAAITDQSTAWRSSPAAPSVTQNISTTVEIDPTSPNASSSSSSSSRTTTSVGTNCCNGTTAQQGQPKLDYETALELGFGIGFSLLLVVLCACGFYVMCTFGTGSEMHPDSYTGSETRPDFYTGSEMYPNFYITAPI